MARLTIAEAGQEPERPQSSYDFESKRLIETKKENYTAAAGGGARRLNNAARVTPQAPGAVPRKRQKQGVLGV